MIGWHLREAHETGENPTFLQVREMKPKPHMSFNSEAWTSCHHYSQNKNTFNMLLSFNLWLHTAGWKKCWSQMLHDETSAISIFKKKIIGNHHHNTPSYFNLYESVKNDGKPNNKPNILWFATKITSWELRILKLMLLLLMKEIPNNHLGCIKPVVNNGINYQPQLVNAGFLPSTVFPVSHSVPPPAKVPGF